MVTTVTDMHANAYGERARQNTMVLVNEIADGGSSISGGVLTAAMLNDE